MNSLASSDSLDIVLDSTLNGKMTKYDDCSIRSVSIRMNLISSTIVVISFL